MSKEATALYAEADVAAKRPEITWEHGMSEQPLSPLIVVAPTTMSEYVLFFPLGQGRTMLGILALGLTTTQPPL